MLTWGAYGNGTHAIDNFTFNKQIYVAVGANAAIQHFAFIAQPGDRLLIAHPAGFIEISFNSATKITISGTTSEYAVREIAQNNISFGRMG